VSPKRFRLKARVSSESPHAIAPLLAELVPGGTVRRSDSAKEFLVEGDVVGESAKELNRSFLSALRRIEKRTRLRAEWTEGGRTERFFDYVSKGERPEGPHPSIGG
jgi:hypothetical protein